jgi:hypothetical protein
LQWHLSQGTEENHLLHLGTFWLNSFFFKLGNVTVIPCVGHNLINMIVLEKAGHQQHPKALWQMADSK